MPEQKARSFFRHVANLTADSELQNAQAGLAKTIRGTRVRVVSQHCSMTRMIRFWSLSHDAFAMHLTLAVALAAAAAANAVCLLSYL